MGRIAKPRVSWFRRRHDILESLAGRERNLGVGYRAIRGNGVAAITAGGRSASPVDDQPRSGYLTAMRPRTFEGRRRTALIVFALGAGWAGPSADAQAQSWQLGARVGGSSERLPLELSQTRFVPGTTLPETTTDYALRMRAFGEWRDRPVDRLGLTLGIDTGLLEVYEGGIRLDRRSFDTQVARTFLLGRVMAELQLGRDGFIAVRGGRTRPRIGEGAVFDAYAFELEVDVDLDVIDIAPVSVLAKVILPDGTFTGLRKTSPLLDFRVEYRFGWTSRVSLLASVFFDTDNELADPVRSALFKGVDDELGDAVDRIATLRRIDRDTAAALLLDWVDRNVAVQTEGVVAWTGVSGRFGSEDFWVRVVALGLFGELEIATVPTPDRVANVRDSTLPPSVQDRLIETYTTRRTVAVTAFFGEIESSLALTDQLEIGTFALVLTADEGFQLGEADPRLGAFLGLSPLVPRTAVFFGGTFGPDQATPTAFSVAPDASGILAAGAHVGGFWDGFTARLDVAAMTALVPSRFTDGRFYGIEIDAGIQVPFGSMAAFVDGGVLLPGEFFDDDRPVFQVVAGVQVFVENE